MNQDNEKSKFVTVIAWIFIVGSGFATFVSILQNIIVNLIFPTEIIREAFNDATAQEHIPSAFRFLFLNIRTFLFGFFVLSAATLTSAIGLLRRRNWARILFVVMMCLGILLHAGGVALHFSMFSAMPVPEEGMPDHFMIMVNIMKGFSVGLALGMSVLLGWIIKKLVSAKIRAEFMTS
jgi:hypothetical protein